MLRERGGFEVHQAARRVHLSPLGQAGSPSSWALVWRSRSTSLRGLTIGDPTAASPLVWQDSPYNVAHAQIQEKFGGVEPLIVVTEGYDSDAMKDPQALRTMERFQRYLERDRTSATASRSSTSCAPSTSSSTSSSPSGA